MSFSPKSFIRELVIEVVQDPRTQDSAEKIVGAIMTKYVTSVIPAAVGAAVDAAMNRLQALNGDGENDIQQVGEAAHDAIDQLLPPWLKPFLPKWN